MDKRKWGLELIWWFATGIVILLLMLPIMKGTVDFGFYRLSILYIIAFVTFTRWIFLWKTHPLARSRAFRYIVLIACIPIFIYAIGGLNDFQIYLDDYGLNEFVKDQDLKSQRKLTKYVQNLIIFFGVGTVITAIALPLRMLISNWRQKNKGTV